MSIQQQCLHCQRYNIIIDYHNGCETCLDCGLVFTDQIFSSGVTTNTSNIIIPSNYQNKINNNYKTPSFEEQKYVSMLYEICFKNHLHKQIQMTATDYFYKYKTLICITQVTLVALLAVCIYDACQLCNVPRSALECCEMVKINQKRFNRTYKKLHKTCSEINIVKPSNIFPRLKINLSTLSMSRTEEIRLLFLADLLFQSANFTPPAVLAYCVYNFSHYLNKSNRLPSTMSMKTTARLCNVSCTCIKRTVKQWGRLQSEIFTCPKSEISKYLKKPI